MGDYATTTSISNLLPGYLRGNTTSSDTAGVNAFSTHITRAENVVNAYVGRKYSLPFIVGTTTTNVPPVLRTLTEDISTYFAFRASFAQDGKIKNPYLDEYKLAIDMLKDIAAGKMPLTFTDGSEVPTKSSNFIISTSQTFRPIFALDDPVSWQRDPDEIRQTESERDET